MKKADIKVGGHYLAKVSGRVVTVRVDAIREVSTPTHRNVTYGRVNSRDVSVYDVTNLATGRKTTFRSAAKFRCEAHPEYEACSGGCGKQYTAANKPWTCIDCAKRAPLKAAEREFLKDADIIADPPAPEGEQGSDPTPATATETSSLRPTSAATTTKPSEPTKSGVTASSGPAATEEHKPGDPGFDPSIIKTRCRCRRCRDLRAGVKPEGEKRLDPSPVSAPISALSAGPIATMAATVTTPSPDSLKTAPATSNGLAAHLAGRRMAEVAKEADGKVAGYTPTAEQASILEVARGRGLKTLVIAAGAGAGKTSTLRMLEDVLPGHGQYTAFNKSLVAESKTKFVRVACHTTHALAFRAVGRRFSRRLDNTKRVRSSEIARRLGIAPLPVGEPTIKTLDAGFLAGQVTLAMRKFCCSADREIGEQHFHYIDGIDRPHDGRRSWDNNNSVRRYLLPFARKMWDDLTDENGDLPYWPDCYVKQWQLGTGDDRPMISADYILLDEAQDTAPVLLDILKQQEHALLVFVGDSCQQIYDWRGAVDAMKAFPDAPRRMLSQSFRFGQTVADVANSILATLDEPTDLVMRGLPGLPSRVAPVKDPKCVLCRTNSGAVSTLILENGAGKKVHLIGGGADVVRFCRAALDLQAGRRTEHPELCCFENWAEVQIYVREAEGEDLRLMVKLIDEFKAQEVIKALENMPAEKDADLVVSTAHKSKGREWDTVKLAGDFPTANKMTDSDRRLLYVAATRVRLVLDITECPPFCGGLDRGEIGNPERGSVQIPGLKVTYTVPMPTEEDLVAYVARKSVPVQTPAAPAAATPTTPPVEANGGTRFSWAKRNDKWLVRGPAEVPVGSVVTVTRRNGTTSTETVRAVVTRYTDAWLYSVN